MDNDNTNVQLDLTPHGTQEGNTSENRAEEITQPAAAEEPTKELTKEELMEGVAPKEEVKAEAASPAAITEDFVKDAMTKRMEENVTPELIAKGVADLKTVGITDPEMATRAINLICDARADLMEQNTEQALKHFGGTMEGESIKAPPEFLKAVSEAKSAVLAIDKEVPGFKDALNLSGMQGHISMILAFQKLYPLLTEDKALMNGGTGGTAAPASVAEQMFGADKIIREI